MYKTINDMSKKEELMKALADIEEQERQAMINAEYPKFKELIGTCYKYRNSYSCPEKESDYWYTYFKITSLTPNDLYIGGLKNDNVLARCETLKFQVCKDGIISIDPHYSKFVHSLGERISIDEFNREFDKVIDMAKKVFNV